MGKKYLEKLKLVEENKKYTLEESVSLIKNLGVAKFDETIDLALTLGVDPKKSDQQIRGSVGLPHGLGKKLKVLRYLVKFANMWGTLANLQRHLVPGQVLHPRQRNRSPFFVCSVKEDG